MAIIYCRGYGLTMVDETVTVGKQHVYVWQGFCYYELGWSPILELEAVDVTYIQSHCVTGSN